MKYKSQNCPVAQSLSILGNHWTLLIARNIMNGIDRFDKIQKNLNISRNLLSKRLKQMECDGLIEMVLIDGLKRYKYQPSDKCKDLIEIFFSLSQWSEKWVLDNNIPKLRAKHCDTGKELQLKFVVNKRKETVKSDKVILDLIYN